jgi:hypothetical protein
MNTNKKPFLIYYEEACDAEGALNCFLDTYRIYDNDEFHITANFEYVIPAYDDTDFATNLYQIKVFKNEEKTK